MQYVLGRDSEGVWCVQVRHERPNGEVIESARIYATSTMELYTMILMLDSGFCAPAEDDVYEIEEAV